MIARDPSSASSSRYDLIVVGGGIYGVCIAYEAVKRGLRPLLIEKDDFGGATSWNSLRIVHGGLRYLQSLDVRRHLESVRERRWFLRTFPELVRPLPCVMPLYSNGSALKRPAVFRAALRINDLLSCTRNSGVRRDRRLCDGRMLGVMETRLRFPLARRDGLCGAALWHDAVMLSPQRIVMEILHAACGSGATALNYVEATSLVSHKGTLEGVVARDRLTLDTLEFRAPIVINAAGPSCQSVAQQLDAALGVRHAGLFQPSLAYNLLLDRPRLSDCALAVSSGAPGSRVYFLYAACGGVLAGTEHVPVVEQNGSSPFAATPTPEQIQRTLDSLNVAVPGWDLTPGDVLRVYSGLLPAKRAGTEALACRPAIRDHGKIGGPRGLYSVSGVKFTTARLVAERVVARLPVIHRRSVRHIPQIGVPGPCAPQKIDLISPRELLDADDATVRSALDRIVAEESVMQSNDLLLRRTNWLDDPRREPAVRDRVAQLMVVWGESPANGKPISAHRPMEPRRDGAMLPVRSPR